MTEAKSKARVLIASVAVLAVLYFIVAGIIAAAGWLRVEYYALAGGVIGSLASIAGLLSLARPTLSQADFKEVEIETLRTITQTSEEIKRLETERALAKGEIESLEQQKQEMQFLVQKASLSLFLQEQHRLYQAKVLEEVTKIPDLAAHLAELAQVDRKLQALQEEIETNPNVDLLKTIIESARQPAEPAEPDFSDYPWWVRLVLRSLRDFSRIISVPGHR